MSTIKIVGVGLILSLLSAAVHAGTKHYYYTDAQGTVLAKADAGGNILATYDYRPYGAQALGTAPSGPAGYTGHVNDPDTGLVYMQARYYDPEMGRFLSVDPVEPSAGGMFGFNRYDYANNNPTINLDPDGRQTSGQACRTFRECAFQNWQSGGSGNGGESGEGSLWDRIKNSFRRRTQTEQAADLRKFYAGLGAYDPVTGKTIDIASLSDAELITFNKEHRQDFANGGWSVAAGAIGRGSTRITTPQARDLADRLGFRQVRRDWNTHGQAVFEKDGRYITPDVDSHSGGTWKELNSRGQRIATLDHELNVIGK